nr:transposase [Streptomyces sp. IB2014 016-6]
MRDIVNAILCQGRTGCQWTYLPHDLPPKCATYCYLAAWRDDGNDQVIHELSRCQVRERARRSEDPTLVVPATQSVHAAAGSQPPTTGPDPAKRVRGRKRGLAVDEPDFTRPSTRVSVMVAEGVPEDRLLVQGASGNETVSVSVPSAASDSTHPAPFSRPPAPSRGPKAGCRRLPPRPSCAGRG